MSFRLSAPTTSFSTFAAKATVTLIGLVDTHLTVAKANADHSMGFLVDLSHGF
jgi:hypothetical protein